MNIMEEIFEIRSCIEFFVLDMYGLFWDDYKALNFVAVT